MFAMITVKNNKMETNWEQIGNIFFLLNGAFFCRREVLLYAFFGLKII